MKKTVILTAWLIVLCLPGPRLMAQEGRPMQVVSLTPQYWLFKGMRVDYDRQLPAGNQFLDIGMLYFYDDDKNSLDFGMRTGFYDKVYGVGLRANHRFFLPKTNTTGEGAYFSYGLAADVFSIEIPQAGWQEYEDGNTRFFRYERWKSYQINTKTGAQFVMGYQGFTIENFLFDFYMGVGFRYTFIVPAADEVVEFRISTYDIGYSGLLWVGGFRIGGVLPF